LARVVSRQPVIVRFVVDKVALVKVSLPAYRTTNGRNLGTLKKGSALPETGIAGKEKYFH